MYPVWDLKKGSRTVQQFSWVLAKLRGPNMDSMTRGGVGPKNRGFLGLNGSAVGSVKIF